MSTKSLLCCIFYVYIHQKNSGIPILKMVTAAS